jgi:hypothetical protein
MKIMTQKEMKKLDWQQHYALLCLELRSSQLYFLEFEMVGSLLTFPKREVKKIGRNWTFCLGCFWAGLFFSFDFFALMRSSAKSISIMIRLI